MILKIDNERLARAGRLQDLCNKYGDFKVAIAGKNKNGEMFWTKHRSVMDCWEEGEKGIWFLAHANNRQILPGEIPLDLDDNITLERLNSICDKLEQMHAHYEAYFTGSRGYHIHIWNKQFATLVKTDRERIRKIFLTFAGADLMKASEVMIAIENVPHWKTGLKKELVREYGTLNK